MLEFLMSFSSVTLNVIKIYIPKLDLSPVLLFVVCCLGFMKVIGFNPSTEAGRHPELIIPPLRPPFHGEVQKPTHV